MASRTPAGTSSLRLPLLPLLLLLGTLTPDAAAQGFSEGVTQSCAMVSVPIRTVNAWQSDEEFQRFTDSLTAPPRRDCPYRSVCAQKLTAVESQEATYSEDCWNPDDITEYTEVACSASKCNHNLTFGVFPTLARRLFRAGDVIECYNHGQLHRMGDYREVLRENDYLIRNSRPMPVSYWSSGMCGAAIYASDRRSRIVHERVLTGDRAQKFALLRVCPRAGCDRAVARSFMQRGFNS